MDSCNNCDDSGSTFEPPPKTYVKGYAIDLEKIMDLIGTTDNGDRRIDQLQYMIMDRVDREAHRLAVGQRIGVGGSVVVITLGQESVSEDLEALRSEEIPVPEYLRKMEKALEGPEVYAFHSW